MKTPSIKGTAFQSVHDDLSRLLAAGRLEREALNRRLPPEDLEILDAKVLPAAWYPLATYERLVELLVEAEAGGDRERYLIERGRRAAERLARAGIYQQLDTSVDGLGPRVGHMIVTLAAAIYNVGAWRYEIGDDGSFQVDVADAAALPEVVRFTAQGFIEVVASRSTRQAFRVESERPARYRIRYRASLGG